LAVFRPLVAGGAKALIVDISDDLEAKRQTCQRFDLCQRTVGGCVIDNNDRIDEAVMVLGDAEDGGGELGAGVPIDDDDG